MTPQLALLGTLIWSPSVFAANAMIPPAEPLLGPIDNYWRRWQQATTKVMAGRHASPIYHAPAAAMDAYWRIAAFDWNRPWISEADAKNVRNLAQLGALMGLERVVRQTFSRSETLGVLYRIGSTAGGANLDIRAGHNGKLHLAYNDQAAWLRADQGTIDDDTQSPRSTAQTRMRTGLALQVINQDPSQDLLAPGLAATAYADARHLGIDALRVQVSTASGGSWSGTLRQGLAPAIDIFAAAEGSQTRDWLPTRASAGATFRLPTSNAWALRAELSRRMPWEATGNSTTVQGEWRAMLRLHAKLRWNLPQPWDGWPLGQCPGTRGRPLLEVPGTHAAN